MQAGASVLRWLDSTLPEDSVAGISLGRSFHGWSGFVLESEGSLETVPVGVVASDSGDSAGTAGRVLVRCGPSARRLLQGKWVNLRFGGQLCRVDLGAAQT